MMSEVGYEEMTHFSCDTFFLIIYFCKGGKVKYSIKLVHGQAFSMTKILTFAQ